jgi:hypothetical protein
MKESTWRSMNNKGNVLRHTGSQLPLPCQFQLFRDYCSCSAASGDKMLAITRKRWGKEKNAEIKQQQE